MVNDLALLQEYSNTRSPEAFTELVRRYAGLVYGTCLRVTGNHQDAEDISQECFLELARKAATIRSSLPGWLHKVAKSKSANAVRSTVTRRRYETKAASEHQDDITWQDIVPHIDEAIEKLPENLRVPIVLYYLKGYNQTDIAEQLAVSQTTIFRLLEKGVDSLRTHLKNAGLVASAALLMEMLSENAVSAAPASLTVVLGKMAMSGIGGPPSLKPGLNMNGKLLFQIAAVVVISVILAGMIFAFGPIKSMVNDIINDPGARVGPTPDMIAKALRDQMLGNKGIVTVNFDRIAYKSVFTKNEYDVDKPLRYRYIRTHDMLFSELTNSIFRSELQSYNLKTGEHRYLDITETKNKTGWISTSKSKRTVASYDPIMNVLDEDWLPYAIERGTVTGTEVIDTNECLRVEIPAVNVRNLYTKYIVWVDPKIGCCPRRIQANSRPSHLPCPEIIDYRMYVEIADGVWFPCSITARSARDYSGSPDVVEQSSVISVSCGSTYTHSDLTVKFPSGTRVTDRDKHKTYVVP